MHLVILLYALFASLFTLQKNALQYTEPFFLIGARMLFAGVVLLLFVLWRYRAAGLKIKLGHIKWIVVLGLSNIYLTNILEIWAIKHMMSSKACLLYSLSPFVSALIAYLVLNERLSAKKALGMGVGFLGILPIIFAQTQGELSSGKLFVFTLAELALFGAVIFSVYGWIVLKKVVSEYNYSMLVANGYSMLFGGLLALGHSYVVGEGWAPIPVSDGQAFVVNMLIMCLISNLICYNLYGHLLKRFSATFMSFAGLVTPLFASLFGFLFLGEVVTWHFYIAMGLFALGLLFFYRQEVGASDDNGAGELAV